MENRKWCENCGWRGDFKIEERILGGKVVRDKMVFCRFKKKYVYSKSECREYSRFMRD